jgi:hypothetical protein
VAAKSPEAEGGRAPLAFGAAGNDEEDPNLEGEELLGSVALGFKEKGDPDVGPTLTVDAIVSLGGLGHWRA